MAKNLKQRGQKIIKKVSLYSSKASTKGKKHLEQNLVHRITHVKHVRLLVLEWFILVSVIIFLAIAQAFWYTESYTMPVFSSGGTYTEATLGKINSLNPLFATTSSEKTLAKLLFSSLVAPDYSGHNGLELASSVASDQTGKIWTLKLRPNLYWSDGQPITLDDVAYTIKVIKHPDVNTVYRANLYAVKFEQTADSIIFTLPVPYANFPSALNFPPLPSHLLSSISPEKLAEHSFGLKPISSGPFSHHATQNFSSGQKIVYLSRNQFYAKPKPLLETFAVHTFATQEEIINALKSGSITATAELSPTDYKSFINTQTYQRQSALNSGVFAFLNNTSPVFSSKKHRQALRHGLDLRSLRAPLEDELPLDYPLLSNQIELKNLPSLGAYDPDTTKKVFSGIKTDTQPVRIATLSSGYFPALAENLKFQLKNLGLESEINTFSSSQEFILNVIRPRNYDILLHEIELGPDPDIFAYYHSSQISDTGLNLSNYNNPLSDDLILAARSTIDPKLRNLKYQSFLKHWVDDVPAIAIYQPNLSYYFQKTARSFSEDNRLIYPTDRFADIYRWSVNKQIKNRTP